MISINNDIINTILIPKYLNYDNYSLNYKISLFNINNNLKIVMDQLTYMYNEYYYQKYINDGNMIFYIKNFLDFILIKKKNNQLTRYH
jgi:hypothetical protein